jgi:hypothetical protein
VPRKKVVSIWRERALRHTLAAVQLAGAVAEDGTLIRRRTAAA